jgi:hypothetical protein
MRVFCNRCGSATIANVTTCSTCGAVLPPPPVAVRASATNERTAVRWAIALTVLVGSIGIGWDVLAAAVLFHGYSFFESVVVCLLVMILCGVATVRSDIELSIFSEDVQDGDAALVSLRKLRAHLQVLFYTIAFLMALVKLVLIFIG